MAYNDFVQNIQNADIDAQALSKFMQGAKSEVVKRRVANDIKTLQYYIDYLRGLELVYSQADGTVNVNGTQVKTVTQAIKDAINTAGVQNGVNANLVVFGNRTQANKNLDTVNVLDYMTANELSAYQADATTFNAAPVFNRASIDCYNKKRKFMAYGTFYTTETIVITSDCDLSQADINTSASLGIDVKDDVSTAYVKRLIGYNFTYPRSLKYIQKPSVGWVANTVGLRITNAYSCKVYFGRITGFETNIHICAKDTGNVYNEYFMGWCENGKVNLLLSANDTGWTNENNFYGGRFSHESGEGTNVAGTRHIKIANALSGLNNNLFFKPSVEGNVAEYHLENGGSYNSFIQARWEAQPPKVLYYSDDNLSSAVNLCNYNLILGGYGVDSIEITKIGTKSKFINRLIGFNRELNPISSSTGGHRYKNGASNGYAFLTGFDAAADLTSVDISKYCYSLSSNEMQGKAQNDTYARVRLDFPNGSILVGNGTATPFQGLKSFGSGAAWTGGDLLATANTYNLGIGNYRWKALYLTDGIGAWGATPPTSKPSVTGSRGGNAALASLITALASYGLITDNTTA